MMPDGRYPPIGDYAFIGDCHAVALVSRSGSMDWCCMPRIDSRSCFGRLLDWERGGYFSITPSGPWRSSRRYLDGTLVLETAFETDDGAARLLDCFPMRAGGAHAPYRQILRVLECTAGRVDVELDCTPRFDYGSIAPWITRSRSGHFAAVGGMDGLLVSADAPLEPEGRHRLRARWRIEPGGRARVSVLYRAPEVLSEGGVEVPDAAELDRRLEATVRWWREWSSRASFDGPVAAAVRRSAIVLKALTNAPTGAIAAAATTSLPESPGGSRNWDYRFSWIRDSCFVVRSLGELGFRREADGFRRFVERSAAGSAEELQVLFAVDGARRLYEHELPELEGYRGARPVRIGNAAERQLQLDVYGELMVLAGRWHLLGRSPDPDYWEFLREIVELVCQRWRTPDQGIWEMRGPPRHYVHSKAMCWVAVDWGIRIAEGSGRSAPLERWRHARDEIRREVEARGYDPRRGVFVQAFDQLEGAPDRPPMDAALLLMPIYGFVSHRDERMVRTTDAIVEALSVEGLLRRYEADDGLAGTEGAFLACSFWLAECLAGQGRLAEARRVFERACATGNDVQLYSEEYDTGRGEMLGNFPQALTHLSLISAAVAIREAGG